MKTWVFAVLLIIVMHAACFGQYKLTDSEWGSEAYSGVSDIKKSKEIHLFKFSKEFLERDITVWKFDGTKLTVSYYSANDKTKKEIFSCGYVIDDDNQVIVKLYFDGSPASYRFTFISTGSAVLLSKQKES